MNKDISVTYDIEITEGRFETINLTKLGIITDIVFDNKEEVYFFNVILDGGNGLPVRETESATLKEKRDGLIKAFNKFTNDYYKYMIDVNYMRTVPKRNQRRQARRNG